jgi:hypothetical protein
MRRLLSYCEVRVSASGRDPNILSTGTLGAFSDGELDSLAFLKVIESHSLERRHVEEQIAASLVGGNEAKPLLSNLFNRALRHL